MIRVNLARNRANAGPVSQQTTVNFSSTETEDPSEQRAALKNLLFLMIGIVCLVIYERYNAFSLNESDLILVREYSQLEQQLTRERGELDRFKTSEEEAKILEDKLSIIRKLSRVRLREVKALDYIQEIIPNKVWLKQLNFEQNSVRISGYSMLDEDLSNFIQSLDKSSFFQEVMLTQSSEVISKSGSYKQFDLTAKLELAQ